MLLQSNIQQPNIEANELGKREEDLLGALGGAFFDGNGLESNEEAKYLLLKDHLESRIGKKGMNERRPR